MVQRDRILPAMCFTTIPIEFISPSSAALKLFVGHLIHRAFGKFLVIPEEIHRIFDIRGGELECHASILLGQSRDRKVRERDFAAPSLASSVSGGQTCDK
jgi:hypothetical protein